MYNYTKDCHSSKMHIIKNKELKCNVIKKNLQKSLSSRIKDSKCTEIRKYRYVYRKVSVSECYLRNWSMERAWLYYQTLFSRNVFEICDLIIEQFHLHLDSDLSVSVFAKYFSTVCHFNTWKCLSFVLNHICDKESVCKTKLIPWSEVNVK